MRIVVTSVLVDDQEKALQFYTDVLGFEAKADVPMGEHRWLTVVSPQDPDGTELLLEPDDHPAARPFKEALVVDGLPFTSFGVDDVNAEFHRLQGLGVRFTQEPLAMGPVTTAVFDDTCGNLIQIAQYALARRCANGHPRVPNGAASINDVPVDGRFMGPHDGIRSARTTSLAPTARRTSETQGAT